MFTIEDTSRSLSVQLPNRGHAITSGSTWHRTGLSFDEAARHVASLNRIAVELPEATVEQIFGLYYCSWFLAVDMAANQARVTTRTVYPASECETQVGTEPHDDAVLCIVLKWQDANGETVSGYYEQLKDGSFYCMVERDDVIMHEEQAISNWLIEKLSA